jgi:hypothetical protein
MEIRHYQPGDETVQAEIFNTAASPFKAFKPASVDEIRRRYQSVDPDPTTKFYAVKDGRVVGYAAFNPNGRISFPWCLPDATEARELLLSALFDTMRDRGFTEAWAAYRADWREVIDEFKSHGFTPTREMINYVAEVQSLPSATVPTKFRISAVRPDDLARLPGAVRAIFASDDPDALARFFWENLYFESSALFGLTDATTQSVRGLGLTVTNTVFADPTKLDSSMPCFRLGAFGTESERHKRVNGMVSVLFETESEGEVILAEARRRLEASACANAAAQAPSDQPDLCRFYDRWFRRQGSFPILSRGLTS